MTTITYLIIIINRNQLSIPTISNAFDRDLIEKMCDNSRNYIGTSYISHIFITVDPSAGLARSNYAIISMFYVYDKNSDSWTAVVFFFFFLFFK